MNRKGLCQLVRDKTGTRPANREQGQNREKKDKNQQGQKQGQHKQGLNSDNQE